MGNFGKGSKEKHLCEIISILGQLFRRGCPLKECLLAPGAGQRPTTIAKVEPFAQSLAELVTNRQSIPIFLNKFGASKQCDSSSS